jgi:hypothetical protein
MVPERFYQDDFGLMLRRQGWHLIKCKPLYADPDVIAIRHTASPRSIATGDVAFHDLLGKNIVRKLLRAILVRPRTRQELLRCCFGNEGKLDEVIAILEKDGLVTGDADGWKKGPECETINNIGTTLEWYVAEWFRAQLQVPARHGVQLEEVAQWGDLDVVAFVDGIRVMVECKSAKPEAISEDELRYFLQRAAVFNPEIAILLIDTESPILKPIEILNAIYLDLAWKEVRLDNPALSENEQIQAPRIEPQPDAKDLYWGARNIFITNVPKSIDASLSAVLRLYHARIRHLSYFSDTHITYDFVNGKVSKLEKN